MGLPLTVWHPMQSPDEKVLSPRAGSPTSPGVNVSPSGVGVAGNAYTGILSRGKTMVESQGGGAGLGVAAAAACWRGCGGRTGRTSLPAPVLLGAWAPPVQAASAPAPGRSPGSLGARPTLEIGPRHHEDAEPHVGVAVAAVLVAGAR